MQIKKLFIKSIKIIKSIYFILKSKFTFIQYFKLSHYLKINNCNEVENGDTILIEVMWKNPNHIFRLWLVIRALKKINLSNIIIITWKESLVVNCMIKWINNKKIIYIDKNINKKYLALAKSYLRKVKTHEDFLNIQLPNNFPAYVIYYTVLKKTRSPQPTLSNNEWLLSLAEFFYLNEQFKNIIVNLKPNKVFVSHSSKTEFCSLIFNSLENKIPVYHLTSFCESLRIKKIETYNDFKFPVDHLTYETFLKQTSKVQKRLTAFGLKELEKRQRGDINDINVVYAYGKKIQKIQKIVSNKTIRSRVLVANHAWFDYPHIFGMKNFTDFLDFTKYTIEIAKQNKNIDWYFKPHPAEGWYGGFTLQDLLPKNKSNIFIVNEAVNNSMPLSCFNVIITVHGTIALEAAALNKIVICADNSYYREWDFVYSPNSKNEYKLMLNNIENLKPKSSQVSQLAAACLYGSIGSPALSSNRLKLDCDSLGMKLVPNLIRLTKNQNDNILSEISLIKEWFTSNQKHFSADQSINSIKKDLNI